MKEELEKLGFLRKDYGVEGWDCWYLSLNNADHVITVRDIDNYVILNREYLFPYNHEKLKQLIKLLS